jgi:hypothetical protein
MEDVSLDDIPETKTNVMLNVADPGSHHPLVAPARRRCRPGADGVPRQFNVIRAHPLALLNFDTCRRTERRRPSPN